MSARRGDGPAEGAAIVNGAAGNVGRAVVRRLLSGGGRVVACLRAGSADYQREFESGDPTVAGRLLACDGDVLNADFCLRLVEAAKARFGSVASGVHTVGGFAMGPISPQGAGLFFDMYRLNVLTAVNFFAAVAPEVRKVGGALVAVSAGAALRGRKDMGAYSASKAALLRLVESLADEGGLRANAVLPEVIDTPANRKAMPKADRSKWVSPDEVANLVAFLLSGEASGVSAAAAPVARRPL